MEASGGDGEAFVEIVPAGGPAQVEVTYPSGVRLWFFTPVSASCLATLVNS